MEDKGKKKIDIKFVHEWIEKLNEGKLSPMAKSTKSLKKKKKNNKMKIMILKQFKYQMT